MPGAPAPSPEPPGNPARFPAPGGAADAAPHLVLGIEISNPTSSDDPDRPAAEVALAPADRPEDALIEPVRTGKGEDDLIPAIDRLCARAGARPAQLACIAVDVGPGAFTGLRVAVAAAKLLAEATGARVVPVPAWDVARIGLAPGAPVSDPLLVCLASKGPRTHGTLLRAGAAPEPLGMITAEHLPGLAPGAIVADRFLPEPMRRWAADSGADLLPLRLGAGGVLLAARGRAPVDPLALEPFYAREPDAVTQWRERRG